MDIRRIPLWESRNATFMSNNLIRAVIEDQGEVAIELSAQAVQGGFVNALSLPYFRGRSIGVGSDENTDWYKGKQKFYQAGGIYLTFPSKDEDMILTSNTCWMVRRYGSDGASGALWRLSEMKSRQEHNRFPGHPVLYSLVRLVNSGEEDLAYNATIHSMLSPPFLESGCFINTVPASFSAFSPNFREVAYNRLKSGVKFSELKHAPSINSPFVDAGYVPGPSGSYSINSPFVDAGYVPGPSGSYDYIVGQVAKGEDLGWMSVINPVGQVAKGEDLGWMSVINPRLQMIYLVFFPAPASKLEGSVMKCGNIDIAYNFLGRMDSPWAFYEGGTPQVFNAGVRPY